MIGGILVFFAAGAFLRDKGPGTEPAAFVSVDSPASRDEGTSEQATVVSITDGDTLETSAGIVRIIGMDTPEREQCGYAEASDLLAQIAPPGSTVTLTLPEGQNDRDRYDRLLRYVTNADGVDAGLTQIEAGFAAARYDSIDGYPAHPKQDAYRAAQRAMFDESRTVITTSCGAPAE